MRCGTFHDCLASCSKNYFCVFCKENHKYSSSDCSMNREARDTDNQWATGKISIEEARKKFSSLNRKVKEVSNMATAAIAQSGRVLPAPVTVTVASERGQLGEIENLSGDEVRDRPKSFVKVVRNDQSQMKLQNRYYHIGPNTAIHNTVLPKLTTDLPTIYVILWETHLNH